MNELFGRHYTLMFASLTTPTTIIFAATTQLRLLSTTTTSHLHNHISAHDHFATHFPHRCRILISLPNILRLPRRTHGLPHAQPPLAAHGPALLPGPVPGSKLQVGSSSIGLSTTTSSLPAPSTITAPSCTGFILRKDYCFTSTSAMRLYAPTAIHAIAAHIRPTPYRSLGCASDDARGFEHLHTSSSSCRLRQLPQQPCPLQARTPAPPQ